MLTKKCIFVKRNKQLSSRSPCLDNLLPPVEDIQSPVMVRRKEKHLVGHESFKARNNYKLSSIAPLSLPSKNEAMATHPEGKQSLYRQRKVKSKSKKLGFKVAQNRLTKKWVVVNKDRQLREVIEMAMLLEALEMSL
jgi:hypothetical protein